MKSYLSVFAIFTTILLTFVFNFLSSHSSSLLKCSGTSKSFIDIAGEGSFDEIMKEINKKVDINMKDSEGTTPLMWAAAHNSVDVVMLLIRHGARVNDRDNYNWNAFIYAAWNNKDPKVLKVLVNMGAEVDRDGKNGITPLMAAAKGNENPQIIKDLIYKYKVKVNATDKDSWNALTYAIAYNKNPEVIKVLLEAGSKAITMDSNGKYLLDLLEKNHELKHNIIDRDIFYALLCAIHK